MILIEEDSEKTDERDRIVLVHIKCSSCTYKETGDNYDAEGRETAYWGIDLTVPDGFTPVEAWEKAVNDMILRMVGVRTYQKFLDIGS